MKRILILLALFFCLITKSFAIVESVYGRVLTNLYGYSNNICTLEEKDIFNFQRLEENIRALEQEDIDNFESDIWDIDVPTRAKIRGTSLSNALRKYLKKYVKACNSCCVPKNINKFDGTELKKMYIRELKKNGLDF